MLKTDRDQLAAEIAALDGLLASLAGNDFLAHVGIKARRDELAARLQQLADQQDRRAKVALYFGGEPVIGSAGVEVGFGTSVVGCFQDLLSKVWGEAESGSLSATGPVKDKPASQLHITNLVHGSFGFLLEELDATGESLFETELSKAADAAVQYIANFANEDEHAFSGAIEQMNPRVFQSIREFFGYFHRGKATFRIVEGDRDERYDHMAVERAWQRAEESNIDEDRIHVEGRLLGVIPVRRRFEFEPDSATQIIEGKVGEKFSHSYLERMSNEQFAGRRWRALLHKRIVKKVGRTPTEYYTLLELEEINAAISNTSVSS